MEETKLVETTTEPIGEPTTEQAAAEDATDEHEAVTPETTPPELPPPPVAEAHEPPRPRSWLLTAFVGALVGALVAAYKTVGFNVPLVVRLEGTEVEEGRKILTSSGVDIIGAMDLTDAAKKVVAAAKAAEWNDE